MSTIQDFDHGWRWMNKDGGTWGDLYRTRFDAMQSYVYFFMLEEAARLSYRPIIGITKPRNIPDNIVRRLWRRERRTGEIALVKSTEVRYSGWLDLEKDL